MELLPSEPQLSNFYVRKMGNYHENENGGIVLYTVYKCFK